MADAKLTGNLLYRIHILEEPIPKLITPHMSTEFSIPDIPVSPHDQLQSTDNMTG